MVSGQATGGRQRVSGLNGVKAFLKLTAIAPENRSLEKEIPSLENNHFQGRTVNFRDGNRCFLIHERFMQHGNF